jgi:hypothetical protein
MSDWIQITFIFIFLAIAGIAGCQRITANRACLKAGYPEAKIDFTFNQYCIKRVDQTDVVVPLKEIK